MKKILALAACLMLLGAITVNGTFAFSLSEFFANVFGGPTPATQAQLDVKTLIQMRSGNTLVAEQGQMLIPANLPDNLNAAKHETNVNGKPYHLWTFDGAVDKFISVKNDTAQSADAHSAYFRTAISVRCTSDEVFNKLRFNLNATDFDWTDWKKTGSDTYTIVATYLDALAPGEISPAMMLQIALDKSMTNEEMEKFGADFEINVYTAAIDAETFKKQDDTPMSAQEALNLALPIESFLN